METDELRLREYLMASRKAFLGEQSLRVLEMDHHEVDRAGLWLPNIGVYMYLGLFVSTFLHR
jgi:hypothetical protein